MLDNSFVCIIFLLTQQYELTAGIDLFVCFTYTFEYAIQTQNFISFSNFRPLIFIAFFLLRSRIVLAYNVETILLSFAAFV